MYLKKLVHRKLIPPLMLLSAFCTLVLPTDAQETTENPTEKNRTDTKSGKPGDTKFTCMIKAASALGLWLGFRPYISKYMKGKVGVWGKHWSPIALGLWYTGRFLNPLVATAAVITVLIVFVCPLYINQRFLNTLYSALPICWPVVDLVLAIIAAVLASCNICKTADIMRSKYQNRNTRTYQGRQEEQNLLGDHDK